MPGYDQTLRPFLWRAEHLYPDREIVSRTHAGRSRTTYAEYGDRVRRLANALSAAGVERGDRVGTFCWNHDRHFETYFAVPNMGAQLHTINPLLPDAHIQYIVENAADRVLIVDPSLAEKLASAYDPDAFASVEQFVVVGEAVPDVPLDPLVDYDSFVAGHAADYEWPELPQEQPAGLCYTSGTTGEPKGVEYTQSMLWSHTMAELTPMGLGLSDADVVMPVVPMFHVNAWGLPFATTAAGAKHVYPGPAPDVADLAALVEDEGVTVTAGVPTVWLGLLEYLGANEVDLTTLERVVVGGAAAPESVIRRFDDLGVEVLHAWGMTETAPVGTVSHVKHTLEEADYDTKVEHRKKQGLLVPGLEMRVVDDDGEETPWNGEEFGELLVRGPWVAQEYYKRPDANETDFEGTWLRTGDIVTVDPEGYVEIVDRADDVIKSGGEWISSQELENAIMGHEDVVEAAVVGVPHERWGERPVAFVVPAEGADHEALVESVTAALCEDYPRWWVPDAVEFVEAIPKTATGKFSKMDLRKEYGDAALVEGRVDEEAAPSE